MKDCVILADTYLSWMPAFSGAGFSVLFGACVLVWALLRLGWGVSQVRRRLGLWILRAGSLAILCVILLGPTVVEEQSGTVSYATMLYVVDGSQSMNLGKNLSRWEESLEFMAAAEKAAGAARAGNSQGFRFGHRLEPLRRPTSQSAPPSLLPVSRAGNEEVIEPPDATDSRLGDALRQLLPQVSPKSSAGVVLLSDGRVRASETVEELAEYYGKAGVPLHVVPVGEASGSGDVAVVSLVVPPRVRKYTENELQVFFRSFGYTGQRTTVRLLNRSNLADGDSATLASIPVTLSGGAQSASLRFRVDEQPMDLRIVVDPLEGELAEKNNRVETRVGIDRTKVRVLYVQDGSLAGGQLSRLQRRGAFSGRANDRTEDGAALTVRDALQADEDIECTELVSFGGAPPRAVNPGSPYGSPTGFPKTRAELFAYDCIIFDNVGPNVLDEEHGQWLAQWIEGRGGGLVVTGAEAMAPGAWEDSPLVPLLPAEVATAAESFTRPVEVDVVAPQHPVWRLRLEQQPNEQLLDQLPALQAAGADLRPKPTAEVLAVRSDDQSALIAAHRAGRGRALVSTAALGGNALAELADSWGPQPERVAAKFWRNIVYWATEASSVGRRRLIAEPDKRFYRPGEPLSVLATAYDEAARRTQKYRIWAMFEPDSLDDMTLYSPILWPENVVRESGEVSPRIAWGEELPLEKSADGSSYELNLMLSESGGGGDSGLRIEMTAYEGEESSLAFDHGTQVDSTSVAVQILSDPFEQQNPLPNHELLERLAAVSGGQVLRDPAELAALLQQRPETRGPPSRDLSPAWSRWWLWLGLLGLLTTEWGWRRLNGLA